MVKAQLHIRRAGTLDTGPMAELLNAIIAKGGTTAMTQPVTAADLATKMATPGAIWHIAETDNGQLQGFQWAAPGPAYPEDWVDIATFARLGATGLGTGSALFEATKAAARAQGAKVINATIRADNSGGLAFYQSRGFEPYARQSGIEIAPGHFVDRVKMRYDL